MPLHILITLAILIQTADALNVAAVTPVPGRLRGGARPASTARALPVEATFKFHMARTTLHERRTDPSDLEDDSEDDSEDDWDSPPEDSEGKEEGEPLVSPEERESHGRGDYSDSSSGRKSISDCTASSQYGPTWSCKKAFDGDMNTDWASKGEGECSWIKLTFAKPVKINTMKYANRIAKERNKRVQLQFSDGSVHSVELRDDSELHTFKFPEKETSFVKIHVESAYSTLNNGAREVEFWYIPEPDADTSFGRKAIATCKASSELSPASLCAKAFDDDMNTDWATNGEGICSWITLQFARPVRLNMIKYANRITKERNKDVELQFSDGSIEPVELRDDSELHDFNFPEKTTSFVKITVKSSYSSFNNGAREIQFWYTKEENCPDAITVSGVDAHQTSRMGVYIKQTTQPGAEQAGRALYQSADKTNYLYYWSPHGAWRIGADYASASAGLMSKDGEKTQCPTDASSWFIFADSEWIPSSVKVAAKP